MYKQIEKKLSEILKKERFQHVKRVRDTALYLNEHLNLGLGEEEIILSSLLHDSAKDNEQYFFDKYKKKYKLDDKILNRYDTHSYLGVLVAKEEFNIENQRVLNAIRYHTNGRLGMDNLEKLVFLSDAIEPMRNYPGVENIRKKSKKNLDSAIIAYIDNLIVYLIKKGDIIGVETVKVRNNLKERQ